MKCRLRDKISFACCCGFIIKFPKALWKWRAYIHNGGSHCFDQWDTIYRKAQCWKLTWEYGSSLQRLHFTSTYIFCRQKQRDWVLWHSSCMQNDNKRQDKFNKCFFFKGLKRIWIKLNTFTAHQYIKWTLKTQQLLREPSALTVPNSEFCW